MVVNPWPRAGLIASLLLSCLPPDKVFLLEECKMTKMVVNPWPIADLIAQCFPLSSPSYKSLVLDNYKYLNQEQHPSGPSSHPTTSLLLSCLPSDKAFLLEECKTKTMVVNPWPRADLTACFALSSPSYKSPVLDNYKYLNQGQHPSGPSSHPTTSLLLSCFPPDKAFLLVVSLLEECIRKTMVVNPWPRANIIASLPLSCLLPDKAFLLEGCKTKKMVVNPGRRADLIA
ncbi:LOW QUALITY PROTEIN: hypothetical protein PanWU01x14_006560 [Parasponia andersonii]|uniref:Uncharacterized protein n=1 Tax=Parasponia andersonii TaxID=3476 RepID=A0A2P5E3T9_PARAD|nr:LOW QUALITY PROTEIN: hypothetical protein PanWU01x14_006560 [Parasponia andersonii]